MVSFNIILRNDTVVLYSDLVQKVGGVSLLKKRIRNSYFDVYKTCLEIFEDDIEHDYMLFFKVKIYTAIEKANKKYHEDFYKLKEEEAIEAYKEYISAMEDITVIHQH